MQNSFQMLPSRSNTNHKCTVLTNLYQLRIQRLPSKYYFYTSQTPIDKSLRGLFKKHAKINRNQPNSFYQQIGFICFYQNGLLGYTQVDTTHTIQLNESQQNGSVQSIFLSKQREVILDELISQQYGIKFIRNSFSKALTRILSNKQTKVTLHKHNKFVFESYRKVSLSYLYFNNKIWIATDVANKIQQNITVLDYIEKYKANESAVLLKGVKIVKNYGKIEYCYLLDIDCTKNPTQKMEGNCKLTYEEYYEQKYKIKIKNKTQPLIIATKRIFNKKNGPTEYVIPQLVSLSDKSYMPQCPQSISSYLNHLKLITPQQKEEGISQIVGQMSAQDIIKKSAINLQAKQLTAPLILTKNKEMMPHDGIFEFRCAIKQSVQMRSWAIAYSDTNNNERQDVDYLLDYFRNLTKIYGVNIVSNPSFITVKNTDLSAWQAALQQNFKKYGKLQIIILFFKEQQQKHYSALKEYLTLKIKCPSQVICKHKFNKQAGKKPYQIAVDLLLQIITKIGAIPWQIKRQQTALSSSLIMHGGLSISKNKQGYSFGLVGIGGKQQNEVYSQYKRNLVTLQSFKYELQTCLMLWAKSFVISCKTTPNKIILYTYVYSQAMSKQMKQIQQTSFFALGAKIGQKTKVQNYCPNLIFINVNAHQKMQFFGREMLAQDFILKNVITGTVVYQQTNSPNSYNFYLSAKTNPYQTSIKPVKYSVAFNNFNIEREELSQFTYQSCYNYYNYQGAFQFPALLQSSLKLAKLHSKFTSTDTLDQNMTRLPYYL